MDSDKPITILIDDSKRKNDNSTTFCKTWVRHLKDKYQVTINKDLITPILLRCNSIVILFSPVIEYTKDEEQAIHSYIENGGHVLIFSGETHDGNSQKIVNSISSKYGIETTCKTVIRNCYHQKYPHPKEALIAKGIISTEILTHITEEKNLTERAVLKAANPVSNDSNNTILYPYGSILTLNKENNIVIPLLSSGIRCYPMNAPLVAISLSENKNIGSLTIVGSAHIISDSYIEKENNYKFMNVLLKMINKEFEYSKIISKKVEQLYFTKKELNVYTAVLAEALKPCLQLNEPIPQHFTNFDVENYASINTSNYTHVKKTYEQLQVEKEPLSIIQPDFTIPLPPLQPAVYPPLLRDINYPALELFDLEDQFSSEGHQLAELVTKCNDNDTEILIRKAADILGITRHLGHNRTAKDVLSFVVGELVRFKKSDQK